MRLRKRLLKGLLNDLFQPRGERPTEQRAQDRDVTHRMDLPSVDPDLDPDPDPLQLHPVAVGSPLDPADHRPELDRDLMDGGFEALASLFHSPPVWDGEVYQWHCFFQHMPAQSAAFVPSRCVTTMETCRTRQKRAAHVEDAGRCTKPAPNRP